MSHFFQASRRSLAYQFTIIALLLCPPFSNFRKFVHFQPCFGQHFSSQDANFPNFLSIDTSFFKENPLPRPYFWKPVWHIPTKKKLSAPPGAKTFIKCYICAYLKLVKVELDICFGGWVIQAVKKIPPTHPPPNYVQIHHFQRRGNLF